MFRSITSCRSRKLSGSSPRSSPYGLVRDQTHETVPFEQTQLRFNVSPALAASAPSEREKQVCRKEQRRMELLLPPGGLGLDLFVKAHDLGHDADASTPTGPLLDVSNTLWRNTRHPGPSAFSVL